MKPPDSNPDSGADATERLLRQALSAEAAEVRPDPDGLAAIQQRTSSADAHGRLDRARTPGSSRLGLGGSRPSWALAFGAAAATATVITAIVVIGDRDSDTGRTPAAVPGQTSEPISSTDTSPATTNPTDASATTSAPPPRTSGTASTAPPAGSLHQATYDPSAPAANQVTMHYLNSANVSAIEAGRLYTEVHTVLPGPGESPALAAVHEFLTSKPLDPDYSSNWPPGVDVTRIGESSDTTTIHLAGTADLQNRPMPHPPASFRGLAVQALLATAGVDGGPAEFTYNGEPIRYLFDEPASVPTRSDDDIRAWVSVTSPAEGQTVDGPVTVTGSANVFEANVNWELLDENGDIVDSGYAMAGFMEWQPFTIDLGTLDPGNYTIRAFESSPKDGQPMFIDDKSFTVR